MAGQQTALGQSFTNTPNLNAWGIDTSSKHAAADTFAAMTRAQWSNYVSNFVPIENQLISFATDEQKPVEAMNQAGADIDTQYAASAGIQARRNAGYGIQPTADEAASNARATNLSAGLAKVNAMNNARQDTVDLQRSILGAPMPQQQAALAGMGG